MLEGTEVAAPLELGRSAVIASDTIVPSRKGVVVRLTYCGIALALVVIGLGSGTAAAAPTESPKAVSQAMVCGGVPVTLTVLTNNSSAAFTASTSVGIAVGITVTETATGTVLFEHLTKGFEHNGLATTTCVFTSPQDPSVTFAVTALFTPAS